jgi:CRP-like cAMP-binding protein
MRSVVFNAGATIISEGVEGDIAYLIVSGWVEVSIGEGAKEKTVAALHAGEVFGEMCLIEPGPRSATVKAMTETECVATTYQEFMASIREDPARAVPFMRTLVQRLRQMNELMVSLDPRKGGLRAMFWNWHRSVPAPDAEPGEWWMFAGTGSPYDR